MSKRFLAVVSTAAIFSISSNAFADPHAHHGHLSPDSHAPIGVMGGHTHNEGEWMTSYRYSNMKMKGNRDGDDRLTASEVLVDFMVAPLNMTMEMHMFGLMYGVSDNLTVMGMLPYVRKSMDHINRASVEFNTKTDGIGDAKITGLYTVFDTVKQKVHLNFGLSLPTGSINERGDTPAGANQKLPYPMQLGSGTFDPIFGVTYLNDQGVWSWGAQANSLIRAGKNNEGYRLGNEYSATTWAARNINEYASISLRLDGKTWDDIHGSDRELTPGMVPTARADLRRGSRIDALTGINLYQTKGKLSGHRLSGEFGLPVYQNLDGPQLETDYRFMLGWQYAF